MLDRLFSVAPGITWPALPQPTAAQVLALTYQLEQTQYLAPETIQARQFEQLAAVVKHAWDTVPFYRSRLVDARYTRGMTITPDWWRELPLLTRSDIQLAGDALRSKSVPKEHGQVRTAETSGSTGQSVRVFGTELNNLFWMAYLLRDHLWHKRDLSQKLAVIRYAAPGSKIGKPPEGSVGKSWGAPFNFLCATGPSASLDISTDTAVQAAWLMKHQPAYLLTYPSNLAALARYFIDEKLELPALKEIRTISELLPPELRELCQQAFGAPITDSYSSNEAGYIATQCPDCAQYHIQSENVLCEVLNEHNEPCEPGEVGRVILTPLHNFAMPLLRYEIRDHAQVGFADRCGRRLPTLQSILGRSRNMLVLPNGDTRWPTFLSWTELAPIAQYQIVQHTVDHLEAVLVTHRPLTQEDEDRLSSALRDQFGVDYRVTYTYLDEIRGHGNGKFEVFISRVT